MDDKVLFRLTANAKEVFLEIKDESGKYVVAGSAVDFQKNENSGILAMRDKSGLFNLFGIADGKIYPGPGGCYCYYDTLRYFVYRQTVENIYFEEPFDCSGKVLLGQRRGNIFIHSDAYLQAIKNAPKIPIQDWSIVYKNPGVICENRKVLFNIDGEILLGEFIREKTINGNYLKPDANSSIGFFVYYKGLPSGKFNVERWDYEPGCFHKNKFDSDGKFKVNGARAKNVAFSHRHVYTLGQRLIFGKNFSADVYPTPINYGNTGEERHYEKFQDIVEDFLNEFSLQKGSFLTPSEKINGKLKKIGLKYCPCYSVKEQKIIENPVFDENLKQNKFHLSSEKHLNRDFSLSSQNVLNANASNYSNLLSSGSVEEENELCR